MKKLLSVITVLVLLVGSVFAENHNKKYEKGVEICQQIANDYNIEVEIKKVAALPNNAIANCSKRNGKYIIRMNWNSILEMTDNMVIPLLIHEMAHAITDVCGHNKKWVRAMYDIVDYFPDMNKYEAYILNQEVEKAE